MKDALEWFREETKKAGFPDLYLLLTAYGDTDNLSGLDNGKDNKGRGCGIIPGIFRRYSLPVRAYCRY